MQASQYKNHAELKWTKLDNCKKKKKKKNADGKK